MKIIERFLHDKKDKSKTIVGRHTDVPDDKFNAEQLRMGIDVEKEHTDCPHMAKEIAKDHLAEIPDYYTRLIAMEEAAGVNKHS